MVEQVFFFLLTLYSLTATGAASVVNPLLFTTPRVLHNNINSSHEYTTTTQTYTLITCSTSSQDAPQSASSSSPITIPVSSQKETLTSSLLNRTATSTTSWRDTSSAWVSSAAKTLTTVNLISSNFTQPQQNRASTAATLSSLTGISSTSPLPQTSTLPSIGVCDVQIWESALSNLFPLQVHLNASIPGVGSTHKECSITFGQRVTLDDLSLPYGLSILFTMTMPISTDIQERGLTRRLVFPALTPPAPWKEWIINITAGSTTWSSTNTNSSGLPYCKVGDWDGERVWVSLYLETCAIMTNLCRLVLSTVFGHVKETNLDALT